MPKISHRLLICTAAILLLCAATIHLVEESFESREAPSSSFAGKAQKCHRDTTTSGYWIARLNASASPGLDTTYWKIYKSPEFEFEIRYPSEWEVAVLSRSAEHMTLTLNDMSFNISVGLIEADSEVAKILAANCPNAKVGGEDAVVASGDYPLSVYLQTDTYAYTLYDPWVMGHAARTNEANLVLEGIIRSFHLLR